MGGFNSQSDSLLEKGFRLKFKGLNHKAIIARESLELDRMRLIMAVLQLSKWRVEESVVWDAFTEEESMQSEGDPPPAASLCLVGLP
jgi:hypothetical protein